MKTAIPTQAQYEAREFADYQQRIKRCEAQPVTDKREACADYSEALKNPEGLALSVHHILAGNYGFWAHKVADEVAQNKRLRHRAAWFGINTALLDHNCPHRYAAKAWHGLSKEQQDAATGAIMGEIDQHNENREEN